jgi:signal transduction histidine kinase
MTLGTSPHPLGAALVESAEAETRVRATVAAGLDGCRKVLSRLMDEMRLRRPLILRTCAAIYLFGLAGVLVPALALSDGPSVVAFGLGHVPVMALLLAGVGLAVSGLRQENRVRPPEPVADPVPRGLTGLGDLLAQMSHELRTPLNAVIGFSEVMRHELHGPLNARYQEYAIHIAESGGRMLKSSQDALAVAEAMTVLLSPQQAVREEQVSAGALIESAQRVVGLGDGRISLVSGSAYAIRCERRATQQAIEHLLREAASVAVPGQAIQVAVRRQGARRSLDISVPTAAANTARGASADTTDAFPMPEAGGLNLLLARLLIEGQGGRLEIRAAEAHRWKASISFSQACA